MTEEDTTKGYDFMENEKKVIDEENAVAVLYDELQKVKNQVSDLQSKNEFLEQKTKDIEELQRTNVRISQKFQRVVDLAKTAYNLNEKDIAKFFNSSINEKKSKIDEIIIPAFNNSIRTEMVDIINFNKTSMKEEYFQKLNIFIRETIGSENDLFADLGHTLEGVENFTTSAIGLYKKALESSLLFNGLLLYLLELKEVNSINAYFM